MNRTKIEWCDFTWNPITGCAGKSDGCLNCYASAISRRFWRGRKFEEVRFHPERLERPAKIKKPARVFVNSMGDLFYAKVQDAWIYQVLDACKLSPRHTFMILTKRPERMKEILAKPGYDDIQNLWIGVSTENQAAADARLPVLNSIPNYLKFVSVEPILGPVNLANYLAEDRTGVQWVIVGPENGKGARPSLLKWYLWLFGQCEVSGVPIFIKGIPDTEGAKINNLVLPQEFPKDEKCVSQ